MGKTVKKSTKSEVAPTKKSQKTEKPVAAEEQEDSIAIAMKKANDLKMKKWMK